MSLLILYRLFLKIVLQRYIFLCVCAILSSIIIVFFNEMRFF